MPTAAAFQAARRALCRLVRAPSELSKSRRPQEAYGALLGPLPRDAIVVSVEAVAAPIGQIPVSSTAT